MLKKFFLGGLKMGKVSLEKLLESGIISQEQYEKAKALESSSSSNRLVGKYGQEVENLDDSQLKSLLSHNVIVSYNGKVYALPLRLNDGKELKLYYRSKTDTEF